MFNDKFETLFRKELEAVNFPKEKIDEDVKYYFPMVVTLLGPQRLNCDLDAYRNLVNEINGDGENFSLYDISFLMNAYSAFSPKDFDLKPTEYIELLDEVNAMSKVWNDMVIPIRKRLESKLQTEQLLQQPKNGRNVIPLGRN